MADEVNPHLTVQVQQAGKKLETTGAADHALAKTLPGLGD